MWKADVRAIEFTAMEWNYLLDTAVLHGELWSGNTRTGVAGELRLRLAQFGPTPADLARLNTRYDHLDQAKVEAKADLPQGANARERYQGLHAVPGGRVG
jgi:fructosamine-3-kinase